MLRSTLAIIRVIYPWHPQSDGYGTPLIGMGVPYPSLLWHILPNLVNSFFVNITQSSSLDARFSGQNTIIHCRVVFRLRPHLGSPHRSSKPLDWLGSLHGGDGWGREHRYKAQYPHFHLNPSFHGSEWCRSSPSLSSIFFIWCRKSIGWLRTAFEWNLKFKFPRITALIHYRPLSYLPSCLRQDISWGQLSRQLKTFLCGIDHRLFHRSRIRYLSKKIANFNEFPEIKKNS